MNDVLSNNNGYGKPVSEVDLKSLSNGDSIRMSCYDGKDRYFYVEESGEKPVGLLVTVNQDDDTSYTNRIRLVGEGVVNHINDTEGIIDPQHQEIIPIIGQIAIGCFALFSEINAPDDHTRNTIYSTGGDKTIYELYVKNVDKS